MRRLGIAAAATVLVSPAAAAPPTKTPAPPIAMTAPVQQDVRCFLLFAAAVDAAGKTNNVQAREATSLAVMYYYGKLRVEAPTIDLVGAVRQEVAAMALNAKEVGALCDAEFAERGKELVNFGAALQKAPQSSSSS
jgi:pectin methylesterase-like acyl-CoA thioesterase